MALRQATKQGNKCRVALSGPAGSGKTKTALKMAWRFSSNIILIDTEHGSASKYAGDEGINFQTDTIEDNYDPQVLIDMIHKYETQCDVLIIDGISPFWASSGGELDKVNQAARGNSNNSYVAWRNVTPLHNAMVDAFLGCKAHLIVTVRTKTAYELQEYKDNNGNTRTRPVKVGLAPIQREGLDYEFDVVGDVDIEHNVVFTKTRCSALDGRTFHKPGADVAEILLGWLDGSAPKQASTPTSPPPAIPNKENKKAILADISAERDRLGWTKEYLAAAIKRNFGKDGAKMDVVELVSVMCWLENAVPGMPEAAPPEPAPAPPATTTQPTLVHSAEEAAAPPQTDYDDFDV